MAEGEPDRMSQDGVHQDGVRQGRGNQGRGSQVPGSDDGGHDAGAGAAVGGVDSFDDMHDSPEDLQRYPSLANPLESCRRIEEEFNRADGRAVAFRRPHRWMTSPTRIPQDACPAGWS